jgi:LCP family protein required for cell wall assembly
MTKFFKTVGLTLLILAGIFLLIQFIPASSIEISSEGEKVVPKKETSIFKTISSLVLNGKSQANQQNILLLGQPGPGYLAAGLTDTIILAHLNPEEGRLILISLPRDLLVKIPHQGGLTKINSLYSLVGIEGLEEKISEITDLNIDRYLLVDLTVVEKVIDLVDGLNVYVPEDIADPYFPGPNYTYQIFNLAAGWRYLDGQTTLKYIRTRYTSPNGDFDRMARQQQIIRLLKQKVLALNPLWDWPTYLKIFQQLKSHLQTDLGLMEIKNLYQAVKEIEANQINHLVIDKKQTDLLTGGLVPLGQQMASVVYPKAGQGNYEEIKEYIEKMTNTD